MSVIIDGTNGISGSPALINGRIPASNAPSGCILQIVNAFLTSRNSTTSTSMVTTGLMANITPQSSTNKIFVMCSGILSGTTEGYQTQVQIVRNQPSSSTVISGHAQASYNSIYNIGVGEGYSNNRQRSTFSFHTLDTPTTTSSITYTLNFMTMGGTGYIGGWGTDTNWNVPTSITLMEVAQ